MNNIGLAGLNTNRVRLIIRERGGGGVQIDMFHKFCGRVGA